SVAVVEARLQRMRAVPFLRREAVILEQFITTAVAVLAVVPAAKVPARGDAVRASAVAENIAVIFFRAKARLQQRAGFERGLFVERDKPSAFMKIRGRFDRVESVQIEVIDLLRKQREADGQTILRIDYIIKTRKRIE